MPSLCRVCAGNGVGTSSYSLETDYGPLSGRAGAVDGKEGKEMKKEGNKEGRKNGKEVRKE